MSYQYIETLSDDIYQMTFVFPVAETRSIKRIYDCRLRADCHRPTETEISYDNRLYMSPLPFLGHRSDIW